MTRRVLVVDDEPDIRAIAAAALRRVAGWDVEVFERGDRAAERAREAPPDAVILDVMMPFVDGMGTVALLAADERTRSVPVVLLTAGVEELAWIAGTSVAGVLRKPFDPLSLAAQVGELLGWSAPAP